MAKASNETRLISELFKERLKAKKLFLNAMHGEELKKSGLIVRGIEFAEVILADIIAELGKS